VRDGLRLAAPTIGDGVGRNGRLVLSPVEQKDCRVTGVFTELPSKENAGKFRPVPLLAVECLPPEIRTFDVTDVTVRQEADFFPLKR
jgi:hypothetical protein